MSSNLIRLFKHCVTLIVLVLLVSTCEWDDQVEKLPQNKNNFEIRKIDYDEILHVENLKDPLEKIRETLVVERNLSKRSYNFDSNESDKIQIAIDNAIVVKRDGYESYSFKILNTNSEKSSVENLIIERDDESNVKYFIYNIDKPYNAEHIGETIQVMRKAVTPNQINRSHFFYSSSHHMTSKICDVNVHIDLDCGCMYLEIISCDDGAGEGDDNNNNDGSNYDFDDYDGDDEDDTGGNGGGRGGSGEGGGDNPLTIGIFDDEDRCPDGYTKDKDGNCIPTPCPGNPVRIPEIAPQKNSGIQGGMFGNSDNNNCPRKGGTDCSGPRNLKHEGLDLKNPYGAPIYAMYDGLASIHYFKKTGYIVLIQSEINGESISIQYFHMQNENRVTGQVSAGQIIGYQGDSGNLASGIKQGLCVSHLHIKVKNSANQAIDPRQFLKTEIDNNGKSSSSDNCN